MSDWQVLRGGFDMVRVNGTPRRGTQGGIAVIGLALLAFGCSPSASDVAVNDEEGATTGVTATEAADSSDLGSDEGSLEGSEQEYESFDHMSARLDFTFAVTKLQTTADVLPCDPEWREQLEQAAATLVEIEEAVVDGTSVAVPSRDIEQLWSHCVDYDRTQLMAAGERLISWRDNLQAPQVAGW